MPTGQLHALMKVKGLISQSYMTSGKSLSTMLQADIEWHRLPHDATAPRDGCRYTQHLA